MSLNNSKVLRGSARGGGTSFQGSAAGSKRGFGPGEGRQRIQVIFNGKISTPQSLVPSKANTDSSGNNGCIQTTRPSDALLDEISKRKNITQKRVKSDSREHAVYDFESKTKQPEKTEDDWLSFVLVETETMILLDIPSLVVSRDDLNEKEIHAATRRNELHVATQHRQKEEADSFVSRHTQTLNNAQKNQNEGTVAVLQSDSGCQTTSYDISDSLNQQTQSTQSPRATDSRNRIDKPFAGKLNSVKSLVADTVNVALLSSGCLLEMHLVKKSPSSPKAKHGRQTRKGIVGASMASSDHGISGAGSFGGMSNNNSRIINPIGQQYSQAVGSRIAGRTGVAAGMSVTGSYAHGNNTSLRRGLPVGTGSSRIYGSSSRNGNGPSADSLSEAVLGPPVGSEYTFGPPTASVDDGSQSGTLELTGRALLQKRVNDNILASPSLLRQLQMVERASLQSIYRREQLQFSTKDEATEDHKAGIRRTLSRGDSLASISQILEANRSRRQSMSQLSTSDQSLCSIDPLHKVKRLLKYRCASLIGSRYVNCLAYCAIPARGSLLAVGYSEYKRYANIESTYPNVESSERSSDKRGLVLFWSPRNPRWPEKVIYTTAGVSALTLSTQCPHMMGVGLSTGEVLVYDLRRTGADWGVPMKASGSSARGHRETVCQLQWVTRAGALSLDGQAGEEKVPTTLHSDDKDDEDLASVSTDGRALLWRLRKGIIASPLMHIKRESKGEGWATRYLSGLCMAFPSPDSGIYVLGDECGSLHLCSATYSDQAIETLRVHQGAVLRARFNPIASDILLTCSADWSLGLSRVQASGSVKLLAQLKVNSQRAAVRDVVWSPENASVFATVTADSKIQLWNLAELRTEPVCVLDTVAAHKQADEDDEEYEVDEENEDGRAHVDSDGKLSEKYLARVLAGVQKSVNCVGVGKGQFQIQSVRRSDLMAQHNPPRSLTCAAFCPDGSTLSVGDEQGSVCVYKLLDSSLYKATGAAGLESDSIVECYDENVWVDDDNKLEGSSLEMDPGHQTCTGNKRDGGGKLGPGSDMGRTALEDALESFSNPTGNPSSLSAPISKG